MKPSGHSVVDFSIREEPEGVRYFFPSRTRHFMQILQTSAERLLPFLVPFLLLYAAGAFPACGVLPPFPGTEWFTMVGAISVAIILGLFLLKRALFRLFGKMEVALAGGQLCLVRRWGPLREVKSRPAAEAWGVAVSTDLRVLFPGGRRFTIPLRGFPESLKARFGEDLAQRLGVELTLPPLPPGPEYVAPVSTPSMRDPDGPPPARGQHVPLQHLPDAASDRHFHRIMVLKDSRKLLWPFLLVWLLVGTAAFFFITHPGQRSLRTFVAIVIFTGPCVGASAAVGLLLWNLVWTALKGLGKVKFHAAEAVASVHPLRPGEPFSVRVTLRPRSAVEVKRLTLRFLCRETTRVPEAFPVDGAAGEKELWEDQELYSDPRVVTDDSAVGAGEALEAQEEFQVPPGARPSFRNGSHRIEWFLEAEVEPRRWPSHIETFKIEVLPSSAEEVVSGPGGGA